MSEKNANAKNKPSGYEYRKRKAEKEHHLKQNKKFVSIEKYVIKKLRRSYKSEVQSRILQSFVGYIFNVTERQICAVK